MVGFGDAKDVAVVVVGVGGAIVLRVADGAQTTGRIVGISSNVAVVVSLTQHFAVGGVGAGRDRRTVADGRLSGRAEERGAPGDQAIESIVGAADFGQA